MRFIKVKIWWCERYHAGPVRFATSLEINEEQVRNYLNRIYHGGNWDPRSLTVSEKKTKEKHVALKDFEILKR